MKDLVLAADGEQHTSSVDRSSRSKPGYGGRGRRQARLGDAEAPIDRDRQRQRELPGRERDDCLRGAILLDRKVRLRETGHHFPTGVGDGGVDLDETHPGCKLRRGRMRGPFHHRQPYRTDGEGHKETGSAAADGRW